MGRSQVSSFPAAVRREMMKSKAVNSDPVTAGVMEVKDDITAGITESLGVGSSMANRRELLYLPRRFHPGLSGNPRNVEEV
jgi:hypothetical protein